MVQEAARESLDQYLRNISRYPLLSAEEEKQLARLAAKGDAKAKRKLVESNLRFVIKIAKSYRNQGLSLADLIQEGNIGLIESIDKFDVERGFRLTTYCGWWIRLAIQRAIEQKARPIKVPINKYETLRQVKACMAEHLRVTGKEPAVREIAAKLKISEKKIRESLASETHFISIDAQPQEDTPCLSAVLADENNLKPLDTILSGQAKDRLESALGVLTEREKKIILWRYGLNGMGEEPASLRKIGSWIGLSAEGVRRIEEQALSKLRRPLILQRMEGVF